MLLGRRTGVWGKHAALAMLLLMGIQAVPAAAQQLYFIHTDQLNTPRLITNNVGQAVWSWANDDPFGNNAPNQNPSGLGNFTCNLRLPGQYFDQETNLHYNYFRDYDPLIGRYVQSDPIGLGGGPNTYAYVGGNPLRWSDAYGLQAAAAAGSTVWGGSAAGRGSATPWWGGRQRQRDPSGFNDDLFPEAGKKPGIKWPDWLRPWINAESAEKDVKQCPVPIPEDPTQPPASGWEWRGKNNSKPGSKEGNWYNPGTDESLRPDLQHGPPIGPHWDYKDPGGRWWRVDPASGTMRPK